MIGHQPDMILRHQEKWDLLPNHLKTRVQNTSKQYRGSELGPLLLEKLFVWEDMDKLCLDHLPGVNSAFLRTVANSVDLDRLTFISLANSMQINSSAVAALLRQSRGLSHLNVKGCVNLSDAAFPEKVIKDLSELAYVNVSFTQVTAPALTLFYGLCPKLATLKMAGCKIIEKNIAQIFTSPSDVLVSLKFRHCNVSTSSLKRILENFPNLHTLDYSSTDLRSLRPLLGFSHPSQLHKLNVSNCRELRPSRIELEELFLANPNLEHIYLTDARLLELPTSSLAKLKTLFTPGMYYPHIIIPEIFAHAANLTYLDLSRTSSGLYLRKGDYAEPLVLNTPNLRILSLQDSKVGDEAAEILAQLHSLHSLFLRGTAISETGLRQIVFGCPWLREVDLASCRRINIHERRTILGVLQIEFQGMLEEARDTGQATVSLVDEPFSEGYVIKNVHNGEEEREALVCLTSMSIVDGGASL
jgi:Leucine-rich repeat (LRR) protein